MIKTANKKYFNREKSWLQFNARVLQEAADAEVPLIDRLRFIGIFSNNLDEFFKVRYATIKRIAEVGKGAKNLLGGIKAKDLMEDITTTVIKLQDESLKILGEIQKELESENIFIIDENQVSEGQSAYIRDYFIRQVSPALVTIILNDLTEFPELKDSAAYLAVKMTLKPQNEEKGFGKIFKSRQKEKRYALVEIPRSIDRFVVLPKEGNKQYIMILDDSIRYCLDSIFNVFDYEKISAHMIKITRDAELDLDNDFKKSFIQKIAASVEHRRQGDPVRFVYDNAIDKDTFHFLIEKMKIQSNDSLIPGGRYHNRRDYMSFPSLGHNELQYKQYPPLPIKGLSLEGSLFNKIAKKDYMQFTPYHSFAYIVKFLREAALDPRVRTIKITIYRLAKVSHVASSLINAVKNGKEVTVQLELRARFDEVANIKYAEQMQLEGVKLTFGVPGLKVHSKTCVVEREEAGRMKRYGFISTGNFNESTATLYTDYTLFTAHSEILKEVDKVFTFFETNYKIARYKHLIVSPHYTRKAFIRLIDTEIANAKAEKKAFIKLKINSLSDFKMIDKLYEASNAGVQIKLIVRGICCLIPGIPGMSENIEAISVVDKYLEHPRLFIFGNGGDVKIYISSADWMTRNIDKRVEVSCPIYNEDIKQELIDNFNICWSDNVKARIFSQKNDNAYRKTEGQVIRSQTAIYNYYLEKLSE